MEQPEGTLRFVLMPIGLGCLPIALRRAPAITRLDTPPRTWYNSERLHPH